MRHTTPVSGVPDSLTWAVLTLAYAGRPSSPVPARLPRPGPSRSVPFTNPFTPTHPDDPPGTCTSRHPQQPCRLAPARPPSCDPDQPITPRGTRLTDVTRGPGRTPGIPGDPGGAPDWRRSPAHRT